MIQFEPFASSSSGCCYRLSGGGASAPLLIDCGLSFKEIQIALDFEVSSLAGCLISHSHKDHCKAAKDLLKFGVDCYATDETWDALHLDDNHRQRRFVPIGEDEKGRPLYTQFSIGGWQVLPFAAVHDCPGTVGFLIGSPDGLDTVLYLTDSLFSPVRFERLTVIACEVNHSRKIIQEKLTGKEIDPDHAHRVLRTHMSIEAFEDLLKVNDLRSLREVHLLHLSDDNSNEAEFKSRVQKIVGTPVYVAQKRP